MALLSDLEQETQVYHEKLERNPFSRAVVDHTISRENYTTMLARLYGFYLPLELLIQPFSPPLRTLGIDFDRWRRSQLLKSDLAVLGCNLMDTLTLPVCRQLPDVNTLPQVLGCLYALEEITMNGQDFSDHLENTLGITGESGGAFFRSYRNPNNSVRQTLSNNLHSYAETHSSVIIAGLGETLLAFDNWMAAGYFVEV